MADRDDLRKTHARLIEALHHFINDDECTNHTEIPSARLLLEQMELERDGVIPSPHGIFKRKPT